MLACVHTGVQNTEFFAENEQTTPVMASEKRISHTTLDAPKI